jgi:hypothetical protein
MPNKPCEPGLSGPISPPRRFTTSMARAGATYQAVLDPREVVVDDLFSAGADVPFHVSILGPYGAGLGAAAEGHVGKAATLHVAGIARVADGAVASVRAVTARS